MPSPWLDASNQAAMEALAERVRRYQIGFLICDNLGVTAGGHDENAAEMAPIMSNWRGLAESENLAIALVHHPTKGKDVKRDGDRLRGHSSIEASLDLALYIEREERSESVTIRSTKTRGADVKPFGAMFTYSHKIGTNVLESARFYGLEVEDLKSEEAIRNAILEAVTAYPKLNKTALARKVHSSLAEVGIKRILAGIDNLESVQRLVKISGAHGAKLYDIRS
jgi:hypothetical protein